jgi:peptidoglycan/xylan/chitin deacetylase (PgdA/CDA1 family)
MSRPWLRQMLVEAGRRWIAPKASPRAVVLCYHSVSTEPRAVSVTPEVFAQHLQWLSAHCEIVPFSRVADAARPGHPGRPMVAITFDDGYADNYDHAFPLLRHHGARATFFVTAGFLEQDPRVMLRFRQGLRPLEWGQVREMRRGGMEFGAHTYSHANLSRLDRAAVEDELSRSKLIVEERLGEPVTTIAYPFGIPRRHFTRETMAIASAVGYRYGVAITFRAVHRSHCPLAIPRLPVPGGGDVGVLRDLVSGAWDLLGLWQERAPVVLQTRRWDRDA